MSNKQNDTWNEAQVELEEEQATPAQLMKIAMTIAEKYPIVKDEIAGENYLSSFSANNAVANFFKSLTKQEASQLIDDLERGEVASFQETINELNAK